MTSLKKTRFNGKDIFLLRSNKRYIYLTVKISETFSYNPFSYFEMPISLNQRKRKRHIMDTLMLTLQIPYQLVLLSTVTRHGVLRTCSNP